MPKPRTRKRFFRRRSPIWLPLMALGYCVSFVAAGEQNYVGAVMWWFVGTFSASRT